MSLSALCDQLAVSLIFLQSLSKLIYLEAFQYEVSEHSKLFLSSLRFVLDIGQYIPTIKFQSNIPGCINDGGH